MPTETPPDPETGSGTTPVRLFALKMEAELRKAEEAIEAEAQVGRGRDGQRLRRPLDYLCASWLLSPTP